MAIGRRRPLLQTDHHFATGPINQNDIVIAVMGPTGVGKSSFVNKVAGRVEAEIGNGLRSKTQKVLPVRCQHPDGRRNIVLVDTPGFDDTRLSDSQILRIIAEWMKSTYENKIKLSGLLYLHRISDVRMAGTPLRNLAVFKDLCGANNLKNVVLVTTMWDDVKDVSDGERRERELVSDFWKDMISFGSRTCRFDGTTDSAWDIVNRLDLKRPRPTLTPLQIQEEMVDRRLHFRNTSAANTLLQSLTADFKKIWTRVVTGARRAADQRKTKTNSRSFRPLSRSSTLRSTSSASYLSATSDSTDTSSIFSRDPEHPQVWATPSGCHPNKGRNILDMMVTGLRHVIPIADIVSDASLNKSIKMVLHIAQHIERVDGTHHAITQLVESSGFLLQGTVQYAAQSKLSKDMKKSLSTLQSSLDGLQNLTKSITKRNPCAPFFLQLEDIAVIAACITSIKNIYDKPNFKASIDNPHVIAYLDRQLNALRDVSALSKCECGILVVPEE